MVEQNSILIVEDEPLILSGTSRLLKKAGYGVMEAETGEKALQLAIEHLPDLILLDVVLPGINGFDVCRKLKAKQFTADLYVCILSGEKIDPTDQCKGLEIGADNYITRPIGNSELLARINAIFRLIKNEKELRQQRVDLEILLNERTADLRKSEEKFSKAFQSAPLLLAITSIDNGRFIDVNDAFVSLTGYSREVAIGSTSIEIGFAKLEDRNRMLEILKAKGRVQNLKLNVKRADGSKMVCLYSAEIVYINSRKRLLSTAVDISDQKKAVDQLLEREAFLNALIEAIPIPVFYKDNQGRYIGCNKAFESFFGISKESLIGKSVFDINPPELAKIYHAKDKELFEQGGVQVYESQVRDGNGNLHDVLFNKAVFTDNDNENRGLIGAILDITASRRAEKERKTIESRLQQAQKMESIGILAGGIAHDFNNILSSIIGFTELSLDVIEKDSDIGDNLQEVYAAGIRAKDLAGQILAFARKSEEELRPIQVNVLINEVVKLIRSSIPTTIEIDCNITSDALIMGNQTQVHQIIMNLCTNAAQAMDEDGGILNISLKDITIDRKMGKKFNLSYGNFIELSVSDNGTGIPPDIIDSIFEPYFTTKGPGEGTGMGLAMVHGIVESYGGKVLVESILGEGTIFTIYLPVTRKRKIKSLYESKELPSGSERILFVDDEASIAKMGSQGLERLGYHVAIRTSSVEALELFRAKPNDFDLIITDMTMPNMTGDKLAIELIKIRPDIPIILCTGYTNKISDDSATDIGIKAFAHKPIVRADLANTVRKVLDEVNFKNQDQLSES